MDPLSVGLGVDQPHQPTGDDRAHRFLHVPPHPHSSLPPLLALVRTSRNLVPSTMIPAVRIQTMTSLFGLNR